jgi:hypothetical protein
MDCGGFVGVLWVVLARPRTQTEISEEAGERRVPC